MDPSVGIEVFGNDGWIPVPTQLVGHGADDIDVSVLAPSSALSPRGLPIQVSSDGLAYGQEVFFLGFPYHFLGNVSFTDDGYPLPFVKRATFSCFATRGYLLDGHNNPGFSGGAGYIRCGRSSSDKRRCNYIWIQICSRTNL